MITGLICLLIIAWCSFWARQHGGGDLGVWLNNLPIDLSGLTAVFFVTPIALYFGLHFGAIAGILAWIWSYFFYQTGHAVAYEMGDDPQIAQSGRMDTLSYIVNPICKLLRIPLGGKTFCWIFMLLKGLLFTLPLLYWCPLATILYPIGYELGYDFPLPRSWETFSSEWYHGALVGLAIALALIPFIILLL